MNAPLFPFEEARARIAEMVERRAAEARFEFAILAKRARRSISQRNRRFVDQLLASRGLG